jgi:hypothetical protein
MGRGPPSSPNSARRLTEAHPIGAVRYVVPMERPIARSVARALLLCACIIATGCKDDTQLEGAPVELSVGGRTVTLQMGDCRIYRVERNWLGRTHKTRVLSTDFYLGFTACTRQSLRKEGDYAIASLCRQAIGAGGGCASSGTYRTRDGEQWEKQIGKDKWAPVEAAEPPSQSS